MAEIDISTNRPTLASRNRFIAKQTDIPGRFKKATMRKSLHAPGFIIITKDKIALLMQQIESRFTSQNALSGWGGNSKGMFGSMYFMAHGLPGDNKSFAGRKIPPVHKYIKEEFYNQRPNFPPKSQPYGTHYPEQLIQHRNLIRTIERMVNDPDRLLKHFVKGDFTTEEIVLDLSGIFGSTLTLRSPTLKGVSYVWLHEFGVGPAYKKGGSRSFIRPALLKAAQDYEIGWENEIWGAKYIMEHPELMPKALIRVDKTPTVGAPIVPYSTPIPQSTAAAILAKMPERHLNWFQLLMWLMPSSKYVSILAALKDVRGAISGSRLSMGSITQWLQSMVLGATGATLKGRRSKFRRQLWGQ